jgi:hypothetical protein
LAHRLWATRKTRGIGILANEETDLIGWQPMPVFPAPVEQFKSKGSLLSQSHGATAPLFKAEEML